MAQNPVSFAADIRPMFRQIDIDHMSGLDVLLDDYAYISKRENAERVLKFLDGTESPQMPPGGPFWTKEQLDLFSRWIKDGCKP